MPLRGTLPESVTFGSAGAGDSFSTVQPVAPMVTMASAAIDRSMRFLLEDPWGPSSSDVPGPAAGKCRDFAGPRASVATRTPLAPRRRGVTGDALLSRSAMRLLLPFILS